MAARFSKLDWLRRCVLGSSPELSHADRSVLMTIFSYTDGTGQNAHPGRQRIIDDSGVNRSKLDGHLSKLERLGYIIKTQQGGNQVRKGWANVYRLGVPTRLMNEESTRGTAEGGLQNPQGAPEPHEGAPSRDTRGTLTVLEGAPSGGTHQVIDQGIHQGIQSSTADSRESDGRENPGGLSKEQRDEIINAMLEVVRVQLDSFEGYDALLDASDEYVDILVKHLGYDYEHLLVNLDYADVPDYIHGNRYEAGKRLNIIINAGQAEGYTVEGAA